MIRRSPWRVNPNWGDIASIEEPVILTGEGECNDPKYSVMLTLDEIAFLCDSVNFVKELGNRNGSKELRA